MATRIEWQTSAVATALGIVCNFALGQLMDLITDGVALYLFFAVWAALSIAYALVAYPRYFDGAHGTPVLRDARAVSFANGLFGYLIGCIWNHNLTRGKRGISHYVFTVVWELAIAYIIILNVYIIFFV